MSELSGPELRIKTYEALGWVRTNRYWHHPICNDDAGCTKDCCYEYRLPAIELDAAVSEPTFVEWCEKKGWTWIMRRITEWERCGAIELRCESGSGQVVKVIGSTPSEARARAIIKAGRNG